MTLEVEDLPTDATATDLAALFHPFGPVTRADIWYGWLLGPGELVGSVELTTGGPAAVAALNGSEYRGRTLRVAASRPRDAAGDSGPRIPIT
jgi:hypothetical protein